jgi:prepilin-type N-terminal cleavage/methylation domain-containing protein
LHLASDGKGLTLVEVLISVAILSVGAVLILQALARGAYALTLAKSRATAYAFAAAKLEDLELAASQGVTAAASGEFGPARERFAWRIDTAPLEDTLALQQLTLTVSWRQGRHEHASSVTTIQRAPPPEEEL